MNRIYTELAPRAVAKEMKLEDLQITTRRIFHPYQIDLADTLWWSSYAIGQRVADHFTKNNRVFLTEDTYHTYSPNTGQDLNVNLHDGYNIGWKIASILKGQTNPNILNTCVTERQKEARDLIDHGRNK